MPFNSRDLWLYLKAQDLATRALHSFSAGVRSAGNDVRMAQIKAEQAADRAKLAQGRLTGMTKNDRQELEKHIATLQSEKAQLQANDAAVDSRSRRMEGLSKTLNSVSQTSYAAGFAISAAGIAGALAFKDAIDVAIEYQRQIRLTSTQIDGFDGNLKQLGDIGIRVANNIAVKFEEVQPALYDIFSSINVSVTDSEKLLTAFAKAAVAGQTDIQSVSRGTIGIMNAFHLKTEDINHILDVQFKLVEKGIGTYDEWITKIGKVSPSAIRAGQSIETMAAALEASTRFGVPAAQSATAVARVFDAFSNPAAIAKLKTMGVNVADAKGNFRDFITVMSEFRDALNKIPGGQEARVAAIIDVFKGAGGTIEARKFLNTLLLGNKNIELFDELLKNTKNSAGAMEGAYSAMADTTAAKSELLHNKWMILKDTVGEALLPTVTKLVEKLQGLLDKFNELDPKTKDMIIKMSALGVAIAGVAGPGLIMIGFLSSAAGALAVAGPEIALVAGIMLGLALAVVGLGIAFEQLYKKSQPFRDIIKLIGKEVSFAWDLLRQAAKGIKDEFDTELRPAIERLASIINDRILPAIRDFMTNLWEKHKKDLIELKNWLLEVVRQGFKFLHTVINDQLIPALKSLMDQWDKHKTGIMQIIDFLVWLGKEFVKFGGPTVLLLVIGVIGVLIAMLAGTVLMFAQIINVIATVVHWIGIFIGWVKDAADWVGRLIFKFAEWVQGAGGIPAAMKTIFNNVLNTIKDVFFGIIDTLFNAGKNLIQGLINGIENAIPGLKSALNFITNLIPSWKGPPEKDKKLLYQNGQFVMQGFINGIGSMMPNLKGQLTGIGDKMTTSVIFPDVNFNNQSFGPAQAGGSTAKTNMVYVTVNTQEISPQYNAAQLGRILAGRI